MLFNNHAREVAEAFFTITNIPIKSFRLDGNQISSIGYNRKLEGIFEDYNIFEKAMLEVKREEKKTLYMVFGPEEIYYLACSICPKNIHRGIFIIGPCSNYKNNDLRVPYKPLSTKSYLVSLIRIIWKECPNKHLQVLEENKIYSLHIKKAIDYIDARYADNITLSNVSSYLNINKSYFCSLFKKETGKTFTEFLNEKRIEKSKELLAQEGLSILDIALMVGFNNQNYYNIIFKKIANKTPLEFRQSVGF
ncbi:helix-turn-helix domain-containing protein [Wansuia hejianensis]|uniref:Helix-turn-helix transcriptional regulator n=1 Tax=Wansuia hejianensis TaxID=2763667 RepID=A0A926IN24_9FIRM|nr:AraC family transcriptional regulator [Wansuia hejianensis]MBC8591045.1 helix-turn-helix transcriptional regulator [Wansuia hejianensis]